MISLRPLLAAFALFVVASPVLASESLSGAPSTVVASQGGAIVTLEDVDAFARAMPEGKRPGFFSSPVRVENLITTLLLQKQLAAEARKNGLDKDPVIARQVAQAEDDALGKARMQQFRADLKLPDFGQLAKEDFIANKSKYVVRGKLEVKHVLIDTKTRSEAEAKALAATVEKDAKAHPDQFDALVEKYSDDPSKADNHGLMIDAGDAKKYVAEFAAAASALKTPGQISPIVKTPYGFHVLQLVTRTQDTTPSFADSKDAIVAKLRSAYIDKQIKTHTDTLRNLPLDANPDLVGSLRTRYAAQAEPAESTASK